MRCLWLLLAAPGLCGSEADITRVLNSLPEELRVGPAAVAALEAAWKAAGPEAAQDSTWRLALAAAQVAQENANAAAELLIPLPREPELRARALRLWLECWRLRAESGNDEPADPIAWLRAQGAEVPVQVSAALALAEARARRSEYSAALAALDQAYVLAKDLPAWRLAVLQRRVLCMEQADQSSQDISRYLTTLDDPVVAQVVVGAPTGASALVGSVAPATVFAALDGKGTLQRRPGKVTLVYVHAFWAPSCRRSDAALRTVLADFPDVDLLCVSLHQKGQVEQAQAHAATLPGYQAGDTALWQASWLPAWGVEALPHLTLVGADGRVVVGDLCAGDPQGLSARLRTALRALPGAQGTTP